MKRIITITMNPALDKSISVPKMEPEKKLVCSDAKVEPGGGGINVSRAIYHLGGTSEAIFLSGGYTGKHFESLMVEEMIHIHPIQIQGDLRENFVVFDRSESLQYRFGMQGPTVTESEWEQVLTKVVDLGEVDYIVMSGSLPPGVPAMFLTKLASISKQQYAKLIVDTSGEALLHAVKEGVYLIKPNLGELSKLSGNKINNKEEAEKFGKDIIMNGGCEIMVVSLGADGALLLTSSESIHIVPPKVQMKSTVGAGDSMVGAMVLSLSENKPLQDVIKYGVAAGTAATMNAGTELCKKEDVARIFEELKEQ
jgi:6-phosphofructokinase 2